MKTEGKEWQKGMNKLEQRLSNVKSVDLGRKNAAPPWLNCLLEGTSDLNATAQIPLV